MNESLKNIKWWERYRSGSQPMYILLTGVSQMTGVGGEDEEPVYCFNSMLKQGIRLAAGSDLPIGTVNPLEGIQVNVTRKDLTGQPEGGWYPEERLSRLEAVKMHTIYGAYVSKDEDRLGSLEVGKQANFVILSGDVFTVPENEIKEIKVLETYIDGDCKYKA